MKVKLSIMLILLTMLIVGCDETQKASFTERKIYANAERSCFCLVEKDDIEKMLSAAERKDVKYLDDMLSNGRAFVVREITKVNCSDKEVRAGIVLVNILEGEHKGKWAYTFSKRVR